MVLGFRMVGPLSRSQHQYLRVQIFAVLARYSAFQGSPAANLHKQTHKPSSRLSASAECRLGAGANYKAGGMQAAIHGAPRPYRCCERCGP